MNVQNQLIESLQKRLQILETEAALTSLLNQYCNTADAHDWADYAATYTTML